MRIIILGAGQVGGTLARNLAPEDNDVTLIDLNEERLRELQYRLDIKTVHGFASHPSVLLEAGIEQADMIIAVTNSDEINMMGCQIAYSLFKTPTKIARIRSQSYYDHPELFSKDNLAIDVCISPEKLVTEHIQNLIDYPGASQVLDFAEGRLLLVNIIPRPGGLMVGKTLGELYEQLNPADIKVLTIYRNEEPMTISNQTLIVENDQLLVLSKPNAIQQVLIALGRYTHPNRRIIIAGGGHLGTNLAQSLENKYRIKVIDRNLLRASELASHLHKGTVLQGDIGDRELLVNENIEFTDVFCAVTNDDEANIMSCLQAKRLGARHVMALVNRNAYVELIDDSSIDHAISPQLITIGSILTKLRRGNMIKVSRLKHGEGEAIELILHGTRDTSQVIGRPLEHIDFPQGCTVAAVVRHDKVIMAHNNLILETGDHVILLLLKRRYVKQVETLFQLNLTGL